MNSNTVMHLLKTPTLISLTYS